MPARAKKICPICCAEVSSFMQSPEPCKSRHGEEERACEQCWEAYLSKEVEEKAPEDIKCMFCPKKSGAIDTTDLTRLASVGTLDRYVEKIQEFTHFRCQNRCWASKRDPTERNSPSILQPHDRKEDGRVFACKFCDCKTCIDCDRPEHIDETCEEYRAKTMDQPQHLRDEAATAKHFKRCPSCNGFWEWDPNTKKGCGYTWCEACKFRFCGKCLVPWVGDGSAYLLGKMAHGAACKYRTRDSESKHSLKNRFEPDDETKARLDEKAEKNRVNKEIREEKKKRKAEEGEVDAGVGTGKGRAGKKQKLATKS